jgi:DNA-binding XRE family transcriptional regulator
LSLSAVYPTDCCLWLASPRNPRGGVLWGVRRVFVCEDYQNGYNPGMSTKKLPLDKKKLAENFGDNLAALMETEGVGYYALGKNLGISFMTIYRILKKERLPELFIAATLADHFGTTVDALLSKPKKN